VPSSKRLQTGFNKQELEQLDDLLSRLASNVEPQTKW